MIVLDTNVLVRVLVRDDAEQVRIADALMAAASLWLPKTVVLEFEWVLRYSYRLSREVIGDRVGKLLGLANLETEDREVVLRSLGWYTAGMDFADALHPASNADAKRLVTFDRKLAHHAMQQSTVPPVRLLGGREQEGGT